MEKINDIEPIIENNFVYYIYSFYALIALFILTILIYFVKQKFKAKELAKSPFEELDFSNINKDLLYKFTTIAIKHCKKDELEELLKKLEPYKYRVDAKAIDSEIILEIKEYIIRCK